MKPTTLKTGGNARKVAGGYRKKMGQHLLRDSYYKDLILTTIQSNCEHGLHRSNITEIGGGDGALSIPLASAAAHLRIIELDPHFEKYLRDSLAEYDSVEVIAGDALVVPFSPKSESFVLCGNLPYSVSSQILVKALLAKLAYLEKDALDEGNEGNEISADWQNGRWDTGIFLMQLELANRLVAGPNSREWGRLGLLRSLCCEAELLAEIPPSAFSPPPKVHSGLVCLRPMRRRMLETSVRQKILAIGEKVFQQRRKNVLNALKGYLSFEHTQTLSSEYPDICQKKSEQITVADLVAIANYIDI